jgi:hypothetical protein
MDARPCLMLDNGAAGAAGLKHHTLVQVVQFLKSRVAPPETIASTMPQE